MNFSLRTGWGRQPNALAQRLDARRAEGASLVDLTESNPTRCGFTYPKEAIQRALAAGMGTYAPESTGSLEARSAVAGYLSQRGAQLGPRQVVLTASTSEAYAFLFKLLCEPGDEVLVPAPTYPLLDFLTELESVETRRYASRFDGAWCLDVAELKRVSGPRTKAVLVVSPGNPTGTFLKKSELAAVQTLCAAEGWALICDEVFADYGIGADDERVKTAAAYPAQALTFSLSGLSKVAGLPQLKLAWMAVTGPEALRDEALARLEFVADAYLSVGSPVQRALPELLALAPDLQRQVRQRIQENRARLLALRPSSAPWDILPAEGGWYAVLRVPLAPSEEERCLALLDAGVLVQPGYFFDFPSPGYLVLSLLPQTEVFLQGARLVAQALG